MKTYIIKVKKTKGFDYLEYDNYPLVDGYYVATITAEDEEEAAEIFGMGYDIMETTE